MAIDTVISPSGEAIVTRRMAGVKEILSPIDSRIKHGYNGFVGLMLIQRNHTGRHGMNIPEITEAIVGIESIVDLHRDKLICNISRFVLPEAMSDEECLTLASILHFDHGIPADYVIPFFARHADAETVTGWLSADGKRRYVEWLKSLPYDEYLKTEHWQATRGPILFRDGGRCRLCNSPDNLNVHHRTYERLGEERPEDLTTLCQPCHQAFHDNRRLCNGTAPPGSTASTQQSTG